MLSGIMTVLPCFCRTQKLAAMTFEMNATQAALALLGLIFFVVLAIQLFRYSARKTHASRKILRDHRWARHRSLSLNIGFTVAIAVAVIAFSFTRFATGVNHDAYSYLPLEEIEMKETPRTAQPEKKPPKPIPTKIEVVPSDLPVEPVVFQNPDPGEPMADPEPAIPRPVVSAPPPRPKIPEPDSLYIIVEVPPMFPGCEQISDREERKKCSDATLLGFIQSRLIYPSIARELAIEGLVAVRFVVETDGSVSGIQVLRDPG